MLEYLQQDLTCARQAISHAGSWVLAKGVDLGLDPTLGFGAGHGGLALAYDANSTGCGLKFLQNAAATANSCLLAKAIIQTNQVWLLVLRRARCTRVACDASRGWADARLIR